MTQRPLLHSRSLLAAAATGCAGLVTQVVWMRFAIAYFGTSSTTIAMVLAISLAGLALGSWWASRFNSDGSAASVKAANRWAGFFLLFAAGTILLANLIANQMDVLTSSGEGAVSLAKQFLINGLAVGVLNFALGAIVPLITGATGSQKSGLVSLLYAAETFGGAAGALFAGFYSIQTLGLSNSLLIAAATMGAVGLLWLVTGRKVGSNEVVEAQTLPDSEASSTTSRSPAWIMLAVMLAGCASLGLEIVWHRLLQLILGTDTHSYTSVAVGYLLGLAIGAALSGVWLRWQRNQPDRSRILFACLQMLVAISSIGVLMIFCRLASGPGQLWLSEPLWGQPAPVLKRFLLCTGLLLVPTTLIGASFPVAVDAIKSSGRTLSRRMGQLYACAAIGNVLGILLAGFVLVPLFGLQATVVGYGLVSVLAGLIAASQKSASQESIAEPRRGLVLPIGLALVAAFAGGFHIYQTQPVGISVSDKDDLKWYREGPVSTVAVLTNKEHTDRRRMVVDGIIIGQSGGGVEEKQDMLAHLPFLVPNRSSDPSGTTQSQRTVLTIGLGSGLLAGEVASFPDVDSVVAVELSPSVIHAASFFSDLIPADAAEKVRTVQGDGIQYLRTTTNSFDAIVSDGKSRPGHAGNVAFFSQDYYQYAAKRLKPNGIFVQWYSLEGSKGEFQTVLRSFANTFPAGYVALAPPDSVYLVGSPSALKLNADELKKYFQEPRSESLRTHNFATVDDLRSMSWLRVNELVEKLPTDILPNTIQTPTLEKFALDIHRRSATQNKLSNLDFLTTLVEDVEIGRGLFEGASQQTSESIDKATLAMIRSGKIQLEAEQNWLDRCSAEFANAKQALPELTRGGKLANFYLLAAQEFKQSGNTGGYVASLQHAAELKPNDAEIKFAVAIELDRVGQHDSAMSLYYRAAKIDDTNAKYHASFGTSLIRIKKYGQARRSLLRAIELDSQYARAHMGMGVIEDAEGNSSAARKYFQRARQLDPSLTTPNE